MKISVIGAGNVGSLAAMHIAQECLGEVVLIDIVKGIASGKALDLEDARHILKADYNVKGNDNIDEINGSDIVVVTAGLARKPGMTREDLLKKNTDILGAICAKIKELAGDSIVIVVTNPLDVMTYFVLKSTGFDKKKVFGMGLTLDASRFSNLISKKLNVAVTEIKAVVIGSHGETMLPLPRLSFVKGKSLDKLLDSSKLLELVEMTKKRGQEIVSLLGTGSAFFAPSVAITELVKAVVNDTKEVLGVSALLDGQYNVKDICIGVPCRIGNKGIEEIVQLELNHKEKEEFVKSAESIRSLTKLLIP